jgi:hypothetical protein
MIYNEAGAAQGGGFSPNNLRYATDSGHYLSHVSLDAADARGVEIEA